MPLGDPSPNDPFGNEHIAAFSKLVVDQLTLSELFTLTRARLVNEGMMPPGRETSLANTKLDECELWAEKALKGSRKS